jgi:GTP-binding protein
MSARDLSKLRNVAIIAHVDHGKTTLVDQLLQASGMIQSAGGRVMDSNQLEQERGITILAKNTALSWQGYAINIVDTPGHADFGGEVERILSMVDSVLLLVDAVDGPMPQTRFVTQKAFEYGLRPIVVVNKIDRPNARPDWVVDQVFELFIQLNATDEQLDFPIVYASALQGYAVKELEDERKDMRPLFDMVIEHVPVPDVQVDGAFQMQVSALDYSEYLGAIGIGRVMRGAIKTHDAVQVVDRHGETKSGRMGKMFGFQGLERKPVEQAVAGDIVCITGIKDLHISDTVCAADQVEALPALKVDEPTVTMTFQVNKSPFVGQAGDYVTSRHLKNRLEKELMHNVALSVEWLDDPDQFKVSGRGELHLSILIENMRREGYELAVSKPEVVVKMIDGEPREPYEHLHVDVPAEHQGGVMTSLGAREGQLNNMESDAHGRVILEYVVPAKGLIGFHMEFLSITKGTGVMSHVFDHYGPCSGKPSAQRKKGALVASVAGKALGYALFNIQERGQLMIAPGAVVYEGMIVGLHSKENDLVVNVTKAKQLTNIRASGSDENVILTPPLTLSLEQSLSLINDDELVEVTPDAIRLRKRYLTESDRRRFKRGNA